MHRAISNTCTWHGLLKKDLERDGHANISKRPMGHITHQQYFLHHSILKCLHIKLFYTLFHSFRTNLLIINNYIYKKNPHFSNLIIVNIFCMGIHILRGDNKKLECKHIIFLVFLYCQNAYQSKLKTRLFMIEPI